MLKAQGSNMSKQGLSTMVEWDVEDLVEPCESTPGVFENAGGVMMGQEPGAVEAGVDPGHG